MYSKFENFGDIHPPEQFLVSYGGRANIVWDNVTPTMPNAKIEFTKMWIDILLTLLKELGFKGNASAIHRRMKTATKSKIHLSRVVDKNLNFSTGINKNVSLVNEVNKNKVVVSDA